MEGLDHNTVTWQRSCSFHGENELILHFVNNHGSLLVLQFFQIFVDVFDTLVAEVALVNVFDFNCVGVPVVAVNLSWTTLNEFLLLLITQLVHFVLVESDDRFHAHEASCNWGPLGVSFGVLLLCNEFEVDLLVLA